MEISSIVSVLSLPLVFLISIPIFVLASLTSAFAFTVLAIRVVIIYLELALAVIPFYLLNFLIHMDSPSDKRHHHNSSSPTFPAVLLSPMPAVTPHQQEQKRHRRSLSGTLNNLMSSNEGVLVHQHHSSISTSGTITPTASPADTNIGLSFSSGSNRDFEGVGGWKLDSSPDEESLWTHRRFELPVERAERARNHRRRVTTEALNFGERVGRSDSPEFDRRIVAAGPGVSAYGGGQVVVPNSSKVRIPLDGTSKDGNDGERIDISPVTENKASVSSGSPGGSMNIQTRRVPSVATVASTSSGSSKGSMLTMKERF